MLTNTSVNGYKLYRLHTKLGEIERWSVNIYDKKQKKIVKYFGDIIKVILWIGGSKLIFWYYETYKTIGYRTFTIMKVANTRKQIVWELTKGER